MSNFEKVIDDILTKEAPRWRQGDNGYTDHPSDKGGPTTYGVTERVARANGWSGAMQDLPLLVARAIYRNRYIVEPQFDKVCLIDEGVGEELIDTGVNMSPVRATTFFQEWLNGFNMQGSRYADLFVDGRIGEVTLDAFRKFRRWRGQEGANVMRYALNCSQGAKYLEFAQNRESQEDFLYGWVRSRVYQQLKETP
jgi:lysozyme family protein